MNITIVGASGKIARLLHPKLIQAGHQVRGIVRKQKQADELRKAGVEAVLCDIETENDISDAVGKADAVLFAAGAGPGSGKERKWTVDRDGATKLIRACEKNDIPRYLMISSMGQDTPVDDEVFQVYQQAKKQADQALRESGLDYVIVKPGRLTDHDGTGNIKIAQKLEPGEIPREDVASVLFHVLQTPAISFTEFDLISGQKAIEEAFKGF